MRWPTTTVVLLLTASCACRFDSTGLAPSGDAAGLLGDLPSGDLPSYEARRDATVADVELIADSASPLLPSHLSAKQWAVSTIDLTLPTQATINTTNCTTSEEWPLYVEDNYCVLPLKSLTITTNGGLMITGDRPLIIVATETITIEGTIDASAKAASPGPGGSFGGASGTQGQGCGGGPAGAFALWGRDTGGTGGSFDGEGGMGGGGAAAINACGSAAACFSAPLVGGSGGGSGGFQQTQGEVGGQGGAGGGAIQLSALQEIHITEHGVVTAGGGGGGGGKAAGGAGGGGGSGGTILLEAPAVMVDGIVAANGGGGGGGAALASIPADGADGASGQNGTASSTAALGGAAGRNATGRGGNGSGAATDGQAGMVASGMFDGSGGGGGGAGRICVRSASEPAAINFSPTSFFWIRFP